MDLDFFLWEVLPKDKYYITKHQHIYKGSRTISFKRDLDYRLICEVEGTVEDPIAFSKSKLKLKKGQSIDIEGVVQAQSRTSSAKINIENLYIDNENIRGDGLYTAQGEAACIRQYYEENEEPEHVIHWFLNGEDNLPYSRTTTIRTSTKVKIQISDLPEDNIEGLDSTSFSVNSLLLSLNNKKFIFGFVNERVTKSFLGSYIRFKKDAFPTDEELKTIQYSLSYLIGKMLVPVGFTKYDKSFLPFEWVYKSTGRKNIGNIMSVPGHPPIEMVRTKIAKQNIEEMMSYIINKYYEYRDTFQLDKIVWYMNYSRLLPLDIQLQPLSTALDIFQKAWFQNTKSNSKGKHLQEDKYAKIISKYIENIKNDLGNKESTKRIINRIKRCNEMSMSERYETLFREIKMDVGEVEKKSIKERNISIHGSLKPMDYSKLYIRTLAFNTLLNRLILKLLEYEGKYIDYSTYGFPRRNIKEPLRGPEGDGEI